MKKKSLSVIGKIFTSVILACYSFAPSVMAIDELISIDNSQDILDVGVSDPTWITNGNSSVTSNVVVLGETYVAPQNSDVTVTFTKLPSNPSTLSINEITLTDEEVDATGAVSNKAYDINTSMMDGTFEYDLTLPSSSNDTKVVYAENRAELLNNVQEVSNTVVDQGNTVKVEDLNHFTIYIVTTAGNAPTVSSGTVNNQTSVTVRSGQSITVKLNIGIDSGDTWKSTRYQIDNGSKICIDTPDHTTAGSYNESFTFNAPSSDGTYDLNLRAYTNAGCSGDRDSYLMSNAIVVDNSITPPVLVDNPLDKYAMNSVTGVWTSITGGSGYSGINTNEIRWGSPSGAIKSGLKFTNSGTQSFNEGNTFYLGMLTHMNWGTYSGTAATGATLQITLDFARPDIANQILTYNFAIEETSNGYDLYYCPAYQVSETPCDDKVTFPNSYGTQVFVIDDVQYTLVIDGFVSEYPSGSVLSAFITEEQKDNSAFLVGHLSSVLVERPQILLTKKTNNVDIATSANAENLYIGNSVSWQYIVQNSGNTTLTNIAVTDNPTESISCPKTTLTAGESMTCTASGAVTSGLFTNTATATGRYTGGTVTATDTSYYNGALFCGDNIKNGAEECDGTDGLPNSEFQCTNKCKLELVESKVVVCHASDSQGNPYVTNQPDKSADVAGHDGHNGPIWYSGITTSWGDIIPPFSYIGGHYDGKNWTAEGQAIWNNGCSVPKGTLIVQKTTLPSADGTVFDITASGSGAIFNGASGTISDSQDYTYTVAPGTYSVIESVPSGWGQTSNTCTNVAVAKGETKYCTIENKKLPVLTINKVLNGRSVSLDTFSFVLDGWRTITFELDGSNDIYVVPNTTYTITETDPGSKYDVTYSTDCTGALDYNETAICTITNTEFASLTILKQASPDSTQVFGFTTSGTGLSDFSLTDDGSVFGSNTRTFLNLLPGIYSVVETPVTGWDSTALCDDGSLNTAINISAGETVICTFTNIMRGAIGGHKYNDADGDYATNNDRTGVAGWTIELYKDSVKTAEATTSLDGAFGFGNLVPGAYQLREVITIGWYKIYPTADYLDVTLLPGENDFGNDFTNVKYPTITVLKNVDTDADSVVDITGATDWTWDVNGIGDNLTGSTVSVNPGTFTISEDQKTNYHVTNLTCNGTNYGAVESQSVTLTSGQDLVCTFTNTRDTGTLRIVKVVKNDNGGTLHEEDFTFVVDTDDPISFENDGSNDFTKYAGGITYDITEPAVAGYATTYDSCTDVTVPADGVATCTITNDDIAPTLTLVKTVVNDNGGTKVVSDFPLFVDSTQVTSGIANSLTANVEYTVSETNISGYEASTWAGDCSTDGKITLQPGDTKTCTIINDDVAPTLQLVKTVTNDDGGTNNPGDWTLYARGDEFGFNDTGDSSAFHTVKAGITYDLYESATPTGYTPDWWSCTGGEASGNTVKLAVGENVTCTISNDDIAPTLRLVKNVVNNNGGNAVAGDWDLTATGTDRGFTDKGDSTTAHTVKAGVEYTLTESNVAGYTPTNLSCTGGSLVGDKLTLGLDEDVICTVTNDDTTATITLTKVVVKNNGGTAGVDDFGLSIGGTTVTSGQTLNVNANEAIALDEAGLTGYSFVSITGDIKCPSVLGGTVTLDEGENLACTITNDDVAPQLTVIKHVVNNTNDVNGVASDFTINITGTDVSTPSFAGSETGTTVTLDAGRYDITEVYDTTDYTQSLGDNCSGTIGIGESKTCTITNTDIDHLPKIEVTKVADDNDIPETGQNVTFTYTVKNTSSESVNITYLSDSVFGILLGDSTCQIGTVLSKDATCSFTHQEFISGDAGSANHENVFTARAEDDEDNIAEHQDNETITFQNVNPDITATKIASVESVPETGADVLFTFTVTNNTAENVIITDLKDDKFGELTGDADCYEGGLLAANSSCSFTDTFYIDGIAPAIHTNTFTATVMDDEENTDSDSATEDVAFEYIPTLKLVKIVENAYKSDGSANNWTLYAIGDRYGFSNAGDADTFHVVTPGQAYELSEEGPNGYTASSWSCDAEGVLDGNTVTLAAENDVTCTITNTAQPGTITVYKDVVDADYIGKGVYSDTVFNVTLNGDLANVKAISDLATDSQIAVFNNLDAGFYNIDELEEDGFISQGCYAINNDFLTVARGFLELVDDDSFYVGNGENIEVVCTNQVIVPELQIAKANNSGGVSLIAGSNVLYTLIVTAPESEKDDGSYIVEDVKVVDLPPAGIKYQPGSWTAVSNVRGNLRTLGITTEPTYASPGKWNLGEMIEGEVVTLTYVGGISNTLDAGKYKDLAWTEGVSLTDNRTLGRATTGFFASTNVNITEPVEEGEVLGITDEQTLPDTGASTILTIGAVCTMLLGFVFLIFNPKKKMLKILGLSIVALAGLVSLAMPTKIYAESGDLAVQIEQPKTPYSESTFKVGFVALDIQSRNITVQCYETTHGAFGPEYTLSTIGNSGNCEVNNSIVTSDGTYEFYIVAKAGTDEVTSDKVSVVIDLVGPSPVLNYTKTTASCVNNLEFTTANDAQTVKVQIFRSDVASFTADSTTLIKEISAGPNQLVTYSDTQPICGTTYFYAVRAVDIAENTSSFVTDKTVVITIVPITPVTPVTPTVVPVEEVKGTETGEETTDTTNTDNGVDQTPDEEVKGVTDEGTSSKVWSWLKYVLIGVGVVTIIGVSYVYAKRRNRGNEIK